MSVIDEPVAMLNFVRPKVADNVRASAKVKTGLSAVPLTNASVPAIPLFVSIQIAPSAYPIDCPILTAATKNNFKLISKEVLRKYSDREIRNPTLLIFKSETQTINYYVSTNFRRDDIKELNKEMQECSGLILSGYAPHMDIINFIHPAIKIFCISGTCYVYDENEGDNLFNYLHKIPRFKMCAVLKHTKKIIECECMNDISDITKEHFDKYGC